MDKKEKYTAIGAVAGSIAILVLAFMQRQHTVTHTPPHTVHTPPPHTVHTPPPPPHTPPPPPPKKTTQYTLIIGGHAVTIPNTVAINNGTWALLKLTYGGNSVQLQPGDSVVLRPGNSPINVYIVVGGITGPAPGKSVTDYYCFTMNPPYQNVYVITGSQIQQCWNNAIGI